MTRTQWAEAVADAVEDLARATAHAIDDDERSTRVERERLVELLSLDTVKLTV